MSTDLQGSISAAISQANAKAAEKTEGNFSQDLAKDEVAKAQNRISVAEAKVQKHQVGIAEIDEQLAPPPTKEVSTGGKSGGTKKVVDTEEVKRLKKSKKNIQGQLNTAQQEVANAKAEAQAASNKALEQAGINAETQTEIDTLLSKAESIKESLSKGETVADSDIEKLTQDFAALSNNLTKEDNKGGILSEALYKPMADHFKDISELLKNPVEADNGNDTFDPNTLPEANKALYDIGITDLEEQGEFIQLGVDLDNFAQGIRDNNGFTEEFSQDKFKELITKNNTLTTNLTDDQKNSDTIIKENFNVIQGIKESTGFSD